MKLTADGKNITIISDGAASHFKNGFQFYELEKEFHKAKWIFSATGHGTGASDGIGDLLIHFATTQNLSAPPSERIENADDFVKYVSEYSSKIRMILLKTEELQNFRTQKTEEWEKVRSINDIRDSHIWQVIRETDNAEIVNVERRMRKTNTHEWLTVQY